MGLTLCCLTAAVCAGKLSKSIATVNGTEMATSRHTELSKITAEAKINETESISSEELDDYEEDDDDIGDNKNEASERTALQPAVDMSLSVWSLVKQLWSWLRADITGSIFGEDIKTSSVGVRRTFGKIRRMQMALLPIVFKFGVISAMIAFLVAVAVKTLILVKILIVMNLLTLWGKYYGYKFASPAPNGGWNSTPEKEVHVHVHGSQLQPQVPEYPFPSTVVKTQPWERQDEPPNPYEAIQQQIAQQPSLQQQSLQQQSLQQQILQQQSLQNEYLTHNMPPVVNPLAYRGAFPQNHKMF